MLVPCSKGSHHCSWPACPLDCPGRSMEKNMNTLKEQRLSHVRWLGARDQQEGKELVVPFYLSDPHERLAYVMGYRCGEQSKGDENG